MALGGLVPASACGGAARVGDGGDEPGLESPELRDPRPANLTVREWGSGERLEVRHGLPKVVHSKSTAIAIIDTMPMIESAIVSLPGRSSGASIRRVTAHKFRV